VRRRLDKAVPVALAAAAFGLAFVQQPGWASSDTKIHLHVEPGGFLGEVASLWNPTGSLGHIHGAQHGGYLFPMGPFFAIADAMGLPAWVSQRLWLGAVLALATWGVVRLMDVTLTPRRGIAHAVAGAVVLVNPYVAVFSNRTSVFLLGYAALPWVLYAARRGLAEPHGWRWPAAIGLITSASGGGVNAASVAWVLAAPALLVAYEPLLSRVRWREAGAFALRSTLAVALASLWWLPPLAGHALYGIDFLEFTEQAGTIWSSTSLTESLRLMGYWISYLGVGYGETLEPYFSNSGTLLFEPLVVASTLLVPGLALAGLVWTRRWRYGPFFLGLALLGLLAMAAGFPDGTPLRRVLLFAYEHVDAVQVLRTTYKAGPLVAVAVACLAGAAGAELAARLRRGAVLALAALGGALLVALSGWPLVTGDALDRQVLWKRIPPAWTAAARDLDRELPPGRRAVVLPGQAFAFYRWGATVDPILPALSERPVAVRNTPPYADLHAVDLLWTVDSLVQQQRLVPGQLEPLLRLMGAAAMVTGTDDRFERSGAVPPAEAARALRDQRGLERASASYGRVRPFHPRPEELDAPVALAQVRRYDVPGALGVLRVQPAAPAAVVDGSAEALAGLAAFGALPAAGPLLYAGDADAAEIRRSAAVGAELVVSDSNRRRVIVASRTRHTTGATLGPGDPVPKEGALLDPFAERGADAQTVAVYRGARAVRSPVSPGFAQFPDQRPFAAFDGSPATAWQADPVLRPEQHWVELELEHPRDVPYLEILPSTDPRARVTEVTVAGRRFGLRPGWNRLRLDLADARSLRFEVTATDPDETESAGGIAEVRLPGLRVRELLRPPRLLTSALARADLRRSALSYLFSRTTADDPGRRDRYPPRLPRERTRTRAEAEADLIRAAQDGERRLSRLLELPASRRFRAQAWVRADPRAPDSLLDRLAGTSAPGTRFESSSRYRNLPHHRASRAFDGVAKSAWIASFVRGRPAWLSWRTSRPATLTALQLLPPEPALRTPSWVRLRWEGGSTGALRIGPRGRLLLPRPVRARSFRLEVLEARLAPGAPGRARERTAVGIAELRGAGIPPAIPAVGRRELRGRCGDAEISVDGRRVPLRPTGSVASLEAGLPLRARGCTALQLTEGRHELSSAVGGLLVDLLRLRSPAPDPSPPAARAGRVLAGGSDGPGSYEEVRVEMPERGWLVLGESFNRGWRASCDGRSLGEPRVVDGFANGWLAPRGCREVEIGFAPQRFVWLGYALGGLACLLLLALVVVGALRARRAEARLPEPSREPLSEPGPPPRWPLRAALVAGAAAAVVLGFLFALRAGILIGPAVAFVLWRGIGARSLFLAAGGLLVIAVPVLYLAFQPEGRGGYNTDYAVELLGAHWVAVAVVVLLGLGLWRTIAAARARRPA
jgi:arabinofuranan 3-O-arabinosyltransferase